MHFRQHVAQAWAYPRCMDTAGCQTELQAPIRLEGRVAVPARSSTPKTSATRHPPQIGHGRLEEAIEVEPEKSCKQMGRQRQVANLRSLQRINLHVDICTTSDNNPRNIDGLRIARNGVSLVRMALNKRALREALGITLKTLHQRTGLSLCYLSQLETGTRRPSAAVALRIWEATGRQLPLEAILGGEPIAPPPQQQCEGA